MPLIKKTQEQNHWLFYLIERYGSRNCESFYDMPKNQGEIFFVVAGPFSNWMDCMKTVV